MRVTSPFSLVCCVLAVLSGVVLVGCKGSDDSAPTTAKGGTYNSSGSTEADKTSIAAGKARLPHGGQAPQ